jgi:predicted transglutaminase-like cysteine proteinase
MVTLLRRSSHWRALLCVLLAAVPLRSLGAIDSAKFLEAARARGPRTVVEAQSMLQMIDRAAKLDERGRLTVINDFFNKHIAFRSDWEVWGVEDYWASPLEALSKGAGDCEDFSIAKYFSLLTTGVPEAKLRMVYVRVMLDGRSQPHMVVAYYGTPEGEPLILDNINPGVLGATQRSDLTPQFSFNTVGLWEGVGSTTKGNPLSRLSIWRDLIEKVRAEGF